MGNQKLGPNKATERRFLVLDGDIYCTHTGEELSRNEARRETEYAM